MKFKTAIAGALTPALVLSHYTFPNIIVNGTVTGEWQYVRMTANHYNQAPIDDPSSPAIRCYEDRSRKPAGIATISAGSAIGFKASNHMGHPGPFLMYMAKVPPGQSVDKWDGSGPVWFAIFKEGAKIDSTGAHFNTALNQVKARIPRSVPAGEYLVRVEHIALHKANSPQFYVACGQVRVTGGGSGNPGPKVSFPGAYSRGDPSFTYNLYGSPVRPYPLPGPPVWSG